MANDGHDHAHEHEHEHEHSALPYVLTAAALFILTFTTYSVAKLDLGRWNFIVAMLIAVTKGSLVVLFFMHLKDQKGASRLTMLIAVMFVLLLIGLVIGDLSTRFPLALPPGSFRFPQP
jgi:cytochrome c oxidase subunit 4